MKKLLKHITQLYNIETDLVVKKQIDHGYLSTNYVLKNNTKKFFLKQYRFDSAEKIQEIHAVKFFFAKHGIPIILPLQAKNNNYFFSYNNTFYTLFPFISGTQSHWKTSSPKKFASAGNMLAHIHELSKHGTPPITKEITNTWDSQAFLVEAKQLLHLIEKKKSLTAFDTRAKQLLKLKITIAQKNTITWDDLGLQNDHLVHGDYHGDNMFFNSDGTIKNIFDLEKTKLAPRSEELLRLYNFMCSSYVYSKRGFENAGVYLQAYNQHYPIDITELQKGMQFLFLKKAHSLWLERNHYIHNNTRTDTLFASHYKQLYYLANNYNYFISQIQTAIDN